jgi:hypothetical protein
MAHVKFKKQRAKKIKPAKPIPPPKPDRPKRSELRSMYRELLSADRDQRVDALVRAMHWYDKCLAYVIYKQEGKWTTSQLKEKNAAERDRSSGLNSNISQKKEVEFTSALQHYEKMVTDFKPPSLKKVLSRLNKDKPKLENRRKKLGNKYGEFLDIIREMLHPINADEKPIQLHVDKLNANFRINSEGDITLDRKVVGNLRTITRRQGMLVGIIQLLPVLSEAAARIPELDTQKHKTGKTLISNSKRYRAVLFMLNHLFQYYQKAVNPKKLIRRVKPKKEKVNG